MYLCRGLQVPIVTPLLVGLAGLLNQDRFVEPVRSCMQCACLCVCVCVCVCVQTWMSVSRIYVTTATVSIRLVRTNAFVETGISSVPLETTVKVVCNTLLCLVYDWLFSCRSSVTYAALFVAPLLTLPMCQSPYKTPTNKGTNGQTP